MEEIITLFGNNIFPVAVSMYLLIYMNNELKKMCEVVQELIIVVEKLNKDVK